MAETRFPVSTTRKAFKIDGQHLEIILNEFSDKRFIMVTMIQKLGTIVSVDHQFFSMFFVPIFTFSCLGINQ